MTKEEIKTFLEEKGFPGERLNNLIQDIYDYNLFIAQNFPGISILNTGRKEIESYSAYLVKKNRNNKGCYINLKDFAYHLQNREPYITLIELLDGDNVMKRLEEEIKDKCGERISKKIFIHHIPLGLNALEKFKYTGKIMDRIQEYIAPEIYRECLVNVRHGMDKGNFKEERNKYIQCGSLSSYLTLKRKERDEKLIRLKNNNELLYTIVITEEVINFIKNNSEMEIGTGKLEGNYIYYTKIPYNPLKYIKEKNKNKKRYYACHCFWARESILHGKTISSEFCNCSLGHAKRLLDGVLECELQSEILETALNGDTRCRFRFKVPDGIR